MDKTDFWARQGVQAAFAVAVLAAAAYLRPQGSGTLFAFAAAAVLIGAARVFPALVWYVPLCAVLTAVGAWLYGGHIGAAEYGFWLRYVLGSQAAAAWQCACIAAAWALYLAAAWTRPNVSGGCLKGAQRLAWAGAVCGGTAWLMRWQEGRLLWPQSAHWPVANLYDVWLLLMVVLALMFQYLAARYRVQRLGVLVYALMTVLAGFLWWYAAARQAQVIRPLMPALQSAWMQIHVPANFLGYGAFCLAAVLGVAVIGRTRWRCASGLPENGVLEEAMYRCVAFGVVFFTVALVSGAVWAEQAWGRYWSWDPKETWALAVWLNYTAWLHARSAGMVRGRTLALWAAAGLPVTAFAFLGVNIFLSGLHSYGSL